MQKLNKISVSAVSYTNTKPFIYGLKQNTNLLSQMDLSLDIPSDCAAKLISKQVDIGLIPVAAIPEVENAQLISSFCIGSVGAVNSVFIFSQKALPEVKTLLLDSHSRTSNNLAKVLLKHHFKQDVAFLTDENQAHDARVLIGDRTFFARKNYTYAYDLGQVWMDFCGLPFMYAAWVANRELPADFLKHFDLALAYGVAHIDELIPSLAPVTGIDLRAYLTQQLDFKLDEEKIKAKDLFLSLISEL